MATVKLAEIDLDDQDDSEELLNGVSDNAYTIVDLIEAKGFEEAILAIDDMREGLQTLRNWVTDLQKKEGG